MLEILKIPEGRIIIGFSDKSLSIGLLELNPGKELSKHNRPVKEELVQIKGNCLIKILDGDKINLIEGKKLEIPARQFHIHSNPTPEKTLTLWKFQGDISEVIRKIREKSP